MARPLLAVLLLGTVAGCSESDSTDPALQVGGDPVEDADGESDVTGTVQCSTSADCGDGLRCVGGPGCDQPKTCRSNDICSAAPPFFACTCGGIYQYVSAGCPSTRYAYDAYLAPTYLEGSSCPLDEPVEFRDARIVGSGFERFEGQLVRSYFIDSEFGEAPGSINAVVENGGFEVTWYDFVGDGPSTYSVAYWIDEASGVECDASTPQFLVEIPLFDEEIGTIETSPADARRLGSDICR